MAEALVGGALLSGFINVVFDRFLSPEAVNLIKGKKLDPELVGRLKTALYAAEALLMDAEYQQFNKEPVRKWLDSLKDAVYKADDSLDHVFTKAATQMKVRTCLPRFLNFKDRRMVSKMVDKIEVEVRRIEDNLRHKDILGLKEVARDNNYSSWRTPATSLVQGNIYGREKDQDDIMNIINDVSDQKLSVIPIVGMGGVGKTTLAQWLYNNEDLMKGFDLKAWVCVSEQFDIARVTKDVIESIDKVPCNLNSFNSVQDYLKEKLSKKKFFIVLDDVWSNDRHRWNNFRTPFQYGAEGSTIVVTTRGEDVAKVVQTCSHYSLEGLSDKYCWSVFAENACLTESNERPDLQEIGRRIVKKCKGSPLAAETLGCLLRTERDNKEWNKVLMSDIWEISVEDSKIIPALLISYYHLPAHLKGCFVYCSLFPKDHKFDKDELILLWMAEDLLPSPKGKETLEEVGNECFDNLASRLFFKQHSDWWNDDEFFVMHDLLHDLSMFLAGDFYCRLEELGKAEKMSIQTRHLSYGSLSHPISKKFDSIGKVESLRTFLPINFSCPSFSIERTPHVIFSKLKYLRVLSFCSFERLDLLPESISKLIHLRYLDLSKTSIMTLPGSLCHLYNLQSLKLRRCSRLTMLPRGMCNLLNLRHLDIRQTQLQEMPKGMSKLKHLHVLGCFVVGKQKDSAAIKELADLSYSDGTLELRNLENVANCEEAMEARLMDKTDVDILILKWYSGSDIIVSDMQTERDILDKLQPHHRLKKLQINGYRGTGFPNWVGHYSYHNMASLFLAHGRSCCMLPSLGQLPSLKSLKIVNFDKLENIGVEFYKNEDDPSSSSSAASPFPLLEDLTFWSMPCWETWSPFDSGNAFPQLKNLTIIDCPRLKGDLPNHLPALETLEIEECHQLSSSMLWNCLPEYLESLKINNCRKIEFQCQQEKHKLQILELDHSCDSLTLLQLEAFPKLMHLTVTGCENLESISLSESQSQHMHWFELFKVSKCKKLKSLPRHMNTLLPNLELLIIHDCPNIDSFPEGGLPPSLKALSVENCEKLLSNLSSMGVLESLSGLYIHGRDCKSIKSFPNEGGVLPELPSLTIMRLCEFPNIETLECKELLLRLTSLQNIYIEDCPKLENIAGERLRKLMPKSKDEVLSLSWMNFAMVSLCETHSDILTLITDLELPVSDWDDKWKDAYLDISVKLLDICNAFSSEISRLNQCNLSVKCALHNLESASSKLFIRACSSLDDWRQRVNSRNPRIERCSTILDNLVGSLDLPKVKNSAKGKVLIQAMYGVKVETVFVCSMFASAFSASPKKLIELDVADTYSWAPAFRGLQNLVNEEIRGRFSSGKFSLMSELESVEASVKELYPSIQGSVETINTESLKKNVKELGDTSEKLSQGLDLLAKEVDQFFQVVLTSRDALLSNLRPGKIVNDRVSGRKVDQQVVH